MNKESRSCPTSRRTGVGTCGTEFMVGGIVHSCKYVGDHDGAHWCDCSEPPDKAWMPKRDLGKARETKGTKKVENNHMAIEKLYSVPQAAEVTTLSRWTIWAMLTRGEIKRTKIGGRTVIRESELLKLIKDAE